MIKISKETMGLVEAVKAVYGKFPEIPEGYEVIGYGVARREDLWLGTAGTVINDTTGIFPRP